MVRNDVPPVSFGSSQSTFLVRETFADLGQAIVSQSPGS